MDTAQRNNCIWYADSVKKNVLRSAPDFEQRLEQIERERKKARIKAMDSDGAEKRKYMSELRVLNNRFDEAWRGE